MTTSRRPARKPKPRTVQVTVPDGDFAGWSCTAKADFPSRILSDLQSGNLDRIMAALDAIVVDHNFPSEAGDTVAKTMADVDPYTGLMKVAGDVFAAIQALPPR